MSKGVIKLELDTETLEKFIDLFQAASERPQMYFQPCNYDSVNSSLWWFRSAFHHSGFDIPDYTREIGLERGWYSNALGFKPFMNKKGLTDEEMAKELLIIESENWKRVLQELKESYQKE
jgi:hypothetical protein